MRGRLLIAISRAFIAVFGEIERLSGESAKSRKRGRVIEREWHRWKLRDTRRDLTSYSDGRYTLGYFWCRDNLLIAFLSLICNTAIDRWTFPPSLVQIGEGRVQKCTQLTWNDPYAYHTMNFLHPRMTEDANHAKENRSRNSPRKSVCWWFFLNFLVSIT